MRNSRKLGNRKGLSGAVTLLAVLLLAGPAAGTFAADIDDAQGLVEKARLTFGDFLRDDNYSSMRDHVQNARGVLIYPQVLKGGSSSAARAAPASSWSGSTRRGTSVTRHFTRWVP